MPTFAPVRSAFNPAIPQNFAELGVSESLVLDLVLRRMLIEGYSSLGQLSRALRVSIPIIDIVFRHMRSQQLVEVKGMSGNDYNFTLSAGGQAAGERAVSGIAIRRRVPGFAEGISRGDQGPIREGPRGPAHAAATRSPT